MDHIAFVVPDMDEALKTFEEYEVEIMGKPFSREGSTNRVGIIKDPNGIWMEMLERN